MKDVDSFNILLTYLSLFFSGVVCGFCAFVAYSMWQISKLKKSVKKKEALLMKELERIEHDLSLSKDRIDRVVELSKKQYELNAVLETPSQNAVDSKSKQLLAQEIKDLEFEKNNLLISILKDGLDPQVHYVDPGGNKRNTKLSEYLKMANIKLDSEPESNPTSAPTTESKFTRKGNLYTLKPGNGNNTIH